MSKTIDQVVSEFEDAYYGKFGGLNLPPYGSDLKRKEYDADQNHGDVLIRASNRLYELANQLDASNSKISRSSFGYDSEFYRKYIGPLHVLGLFGGALGTLSWSIHPVLGLLSGSIMTNSLLAITQIENGIHGAEGAHWAAERYKYLSGGYDAEGLKQLSHELGKKRA